MDSQFKTLYAFNLAYCEKLMSDIPDDQIRLQPTRGVNTPAWIVAHLAVTSDSALRLFGKSPRLPAEWHTAFTRGNEPNAPDAPTPNKEDLLAALRSAHAALEAELPGADATVLAGPNPLAFLAPHLPTAGDLLAHVLSTHESLHLGHLSSWRRQMGHPPLF